MCSIDCKFTLSDDDAFYDAFCEFICASCVFFASIDTFYVTS